MKHALCGYLHFIYYFMENVYSTEKQQNLKYVFDTLFEYSNEKDYNEKIPFNISCIFHLFANFIVI